MRPVHYLDQFRRVPLKALLSGVYCIDILHFLADNSFLYTGEQTFENKICNIKISFLFDKEMFKVLSI